MKKTVYITIAIIIGIIAVVGYLRFVVGGDEDTWLCENGQWVKHGVPSAQMPTSGCGDENTNTTTNTVVNSTTNPNLNTLIQTNTIAPPPPPQDKNQFNWSTMQQGPYKDSITYALSNDLLNWSPSDVILPVQENIAQSGNGMNGVFTMSQEAT